MGIKSFGSDPEFMLTLDGNLISAIEVVKFSPEHRKRSGGHEFYYDNVLAECAIKPSKTKTAVVKNFGDCLKKYASLVGDHKLSLISSADFPKSALKNPIAKIVGCSKEFCAYTMSQKEPPTEAIKGGTLRTCGGHIHIGAKILQSSGADPILAVYLLDLFLGVTSLWLDRDPTSARRRTMYGEAGSYRMKPYGVEYRALGNFWLESPEMVELIYDITAMTVDYIESGEGWKDWSFNIDNYFSTYDAETSWSCHTYDVKTLRKGIKCSNKEMLKNHLELAKSKMPKELWNRIEEMMDRPQDQDMYKNWQIN